ncbi:MAG: TIGR03663 family protein [Oscillochloris sp.]|nr:TIGR03663 family protein [Oscillochloris sp.]
MAVDTLSRSPRPALLERTVDLSRLNWEIAAYIAIIALSMFAHLWGLDRMAMHHDESIHAWSSWRLYTGAGGFNCWSGLDENGQARGGITAPTYCYDPVYHGPTLYYFTALSYFIFGDGDAQARLPMAISGILLTASAWWLRPYLGRAGALAAALLLAFSPSLLYYTRFARHDGLMVLWELWMLIGVFRWLDTGRAGWLYLTAASIALAIGTHELYYILFFIFGIFVLMRLISESRFSRYLNIGLLGLIGFCLVLMVINPPLPIGRGLYLGEKAFLIASAVLLGWLCQRLWDPRPLLTDQLRELWFERRSTVWVALGILGGLYLVMYSTFFAYPRGAIDGLYAGLSYWLGSQQEYARGDQPWYYYLIQLPLYEPLAVICGIGMVGAMITAVTRRFLADRRDRTAVAANPETNENPPESAADDVPAVGVTPATPEVAALKPWDLFPLLMVFWFFTATIVFSWAGEKMPWLVVHMALPGNLLAAWVIGKLFNTIAAHTRETSQGDPTQSRPSVWLVPVATSLVVVALAVAFWRFAQPGSGQGAQSNLLQGLVPLLIAGGLIYGLLTLAAHLGNRVVLAAAGITLAVMVGAYTLRASWMVVYQHPDTPVELLIYTQTAPDVPRYVADIRELAVNLTRGSRSPQDVTGGLSMPVFVDSGDASGDGSLAWPLQWYLRDFRNLAWTKRDDYQTNPSPSSFEVQMPDGSTALAPVVLLYKPHVTEPVRDVLSQHYVQPYGPTGVFNWWFPEGDKCSPDSPGYKRFYYSTWTRPEDVSSDGSNPCGRDITAELPGPFAPLLWPFQSENLGTLYNFLVYRELPYPLQPGGREMEVWLRSDLAGGFADGTTTGSAAPQLRLVAQQAITLPADAAGPTGITTDTQGNLYIADTGTHRVLIYGSDGELIRTLGGFGNQSGQFYEPRGLAVDAQGNLYVADTWNARIVKFDPEGRVLASWGSGDQDLADGRIATITDGTIAGNQANPLGLFGPRGVAVDNQGNVYIADTGNKRIVVTDSEGNYLYQWGSAGTELGQFNEPTNVAVDAQGQVYVADTWNGRVQIFGPDGSGQVGPIPIITWNVAGWRPNTYDDPSIASSPEGDVYVSVPSRQQVVAANMRGDTLLRWGGGGNDLASLNAPSGMAIAPDGSVWVADRTSRQVLRFVLPSVQPAP